MYEVWASMVAATEEFSGWATPARRHGNIQVTIANKSYLSDIGHDSHLLFHQIAFGHPERISKGQTK
jgi:arylamine N-acetyltransferase